MPDTTVNIPGVGTVNFPSSMSSDEISAASQKLYEDHASFWQKHPNVAEAARQGLNALPGIGAVVGGVLGTPADLATLGGGTLVGGALGAGIGRGARDLATEAMGLEPTSSPLAKAGRIALDTGVAAVTPGITEAATSPLRTGKELYEAVPDVAPAWLKKVLTAGPKFLKNVAPEATEQPLLTRPPVPSPGALNTGASMSAAMPDATPAVSNEELMQMLTKGEPSVMSREQASANVKIKGILHNRVGGLIKNLSGGDPDLASELRTEASTAIERGQNPFDATRAYANAARYGKIIDEPLELPAAGETGTGTGTGMLQTGESEPAIKAALTHDSHPNTIGALVQKYGSSAVKKVLKDAGNAQAYDNWKLMTGK